MKCIKSKNTKNSEKKTKKYKRLKLFLTKDKKYKRLKHSVFKEIPFCIDTEPSDEIGESTVDYALNLYDRIIYEEMDKINAASRSIESIYETLPNSKQESVYEDCTGSSWSFYNR